MSDTKRGIYLDYNASAPLHPKVKAAIPEACDAYGNASSTHKKGKEAKTLFNETRQILADTIHTSSQHLYFTSGGTESNAIALLGIHCDEIITSPVEHDSVYKVACNRGCPVAEIPVLPSGKLNIAALEKILKEKQGRSLLVSIQYANAETGVIQPVKEIVELTHSHGGLLHVDAVQALGKLPISLKDTPVDLMSFSAHKIGGPKGVGALYVKEGTPIKALYEGGGQERSLRSGTENTMGIAGFGAALKVVSPFSWKSTKNLQEYLELSLEAIGLISIHGKQGERLPNTTYFSYAEGLPSSTQVMRLDLEDIYVSSGSACSSGKVKASRTLQAMGITGKELETAIRVSTGPETTKQDIDAFLKAWKTMHSIHLSNLERAYA